MMLFPKKKKKIFVALSGGVDSAVSAYLLKKQGYDVYGGFIKGYNVDGCQEKDAADAARVAAHLQIPFYAFDMEKEYERRVVQYLLEGYKKGTTPNPDVVCNTEIKFGLFYEEAMKLGADAVASGHYAILRRSMGGEWGLYEGRDANKDQSYFLWQVRKDRFPKILFPVGKLTKPRVRILAQRAQLPNADKKDSQGVCFLGKFDFNEFLRLNLGAKEGIVADTHGNKVGTHSGVHLYTIGQRHGFQNLTNKPLYVIAKNIEKNELIAVHEDDQELLTHQFVVSQLSFLDDGFEKSILRGKRQRTYARCRYRQKPVACSIERKGDHMLVTLVKDGALFPAAGQSCVFYSRRGKVLGGGIITGYEN